MINKLTYKIVDILINNEYTEIIEKNRRTNEERNIEGTKIKFKYEHEGNKGYLSVGKSKEDTIFEVEDICVEEVILDDESVTVETKEKSYYFYKKQHMIF
ncbi:hypothetical protein CHL78_014160 [Romboutsia weinsteinii]|uniref:Uncharacterized protein n=1 Tax=Romboutsia weinsteinii TaxID=2020949 RepID=A0A371J0J0_9FIRM|nr:hypothetical protein [Romboutsia weinsteinii]RDY26321.1 hypothetical protein CHL78_014160 [Romboutsia weinsteinii]